MAVKRVIVVVCDVRKHCNPDFLPLPNDLGSIGEIVEAVKERGWTYDDQKRFRCPACRFGKRGAVMIGEEKSE